MEWGVFFNVFQCVQILIFSSGRCWEEISVYYCVIYSSSFYAVFKERGDVHICNNNKFFPAEEQYVSVCMKWIKPSVAILFLFLISNFKKIQQR